MVMTTYGMNIKDQITLATQAAVCEFVRGQNIYLYKYSIFYCNGKYYAQLQSLQ